MIDGGTKLLAIIGDPVVQARSPALINAALAARRDRAVLVPMHLPAGRIEAVTAALRHIRNFHGAVITMPHKEKVLPLLDSVTTEAAQAGACNVIRREPDGRLTGDMLDGKAVLSCVALDLTEHEVFLTGAGGAARGIAFALAENARRIRIHNRTVAKAQALAVQVNGAVGQRNRETVCVNATPVGMAAGDPVPFSLSPPPKLVVDLVVRNGTALVTQARALGCGVVTGEQVLQAQVDLLVGYMLGGPDE